MAAIPVPTRRRRWTIGLFRLAMILASFAAHAAASAAAPAPTCAMPHTINSVANGPITLTINPSTSWQPRGGQVLVAVQSNDAALNGLHYIACFTWDRLDPATYVPVQPAKAQPQPSQPSQPWAAGTVEIRPSTTTGLVNLGITIPNLGASPSSLLARWNGDYPFTGMGLVPVSNLRIIGFDKDNAVLTDVIRPIGITSILASLAIAIGTVTLALVVIHTLVGTQAASSGTGPFALDWLLRLSRMPDGRASLSGFQVLIWTLVIAGGSVYVMALSGDLVNLPDGALTVLGIAGGAKLLAANADAKAARKKAAAANPPAPVPPRWKDLILEPGTCDPNVSRMQMLLFTCISAAFVLMTVLNYYVIPDIPPGYQILMGISNGLYVGRKFTG
jgi:hypothetical protein